MISAFVDGVFYRASWWGQGVVVLSTILTFCLCMTHWYLTRQIQIIFAICLVCFYTLKWFVVWGRTPNLLLRYRCWALLHAPNLEFLVYLFFILKKKLLSIWPHVTLSFRHVDFHQFYRRKYHFCFNHKQCIIYDMIWN
jgi:hypothetical protein